MFNEIFINKNDIHFKIVEYVEDVKKFMDYLFKNNLNFKYKDIIKDEYSKLLRISCNSNSEERRSKKDLQSITDNKGSKEDIDMNTEILRMKIDNNIKAKYNLDNFFENL